ncbi:MULTISPECIES: NAD-dependent epimerase/dehydratase family protein [Spirosoma]|uniref:NAD-dependent epimerase/dehydratase family protein n=1 Tax=Spirosoma liriopis TaxID=2937440 RepID=A0ABT0HUS0_9BACT|nr:MULTISPECIES: NAD-dependent epimerase/dehydratase family protein [Spirosoma]MCK8495944.1 NAD-dependent epimerase/dehydratase family protein [Spirosoma liriopis]UHG92919.1 NAD-dependent epimerase/dehydratase family protein [Spirosoma oryzicola]
MKRETILVIGANGQIGTALLPRLQDSFGLNNVIAADLRRPQSEHGPFELLDATKPDALTEVVRRHRVTQIYHLAAVLSAKGESDPLWAWNLNMQTALNVLEVARLHKVKKVFIPSSIAAFGDHAPKYETPQNAFLDPSTVYGISKVATENWSLYYHNRYGLDVRSLRYPGVISYQSMPGGGTTDYAVSIFHEAVQGHSFECFLADDTRLPMIYMDDALRATLELMEAPQSQISVRTSYNLAGMSFTPAELTAAIQTYFPDFVTRYKPDFRQAIADSWPKTIDDSVARQDWGWKPAFDLARMTHDMITNLTAVYQPLVSIH